MSQTIAVTGVAQLVNEGLISSDLATRNLTITPALNNTGTLRAINAATLTINSANFTNAPGGMLSATGGSTLALQQAWHTLIPAGSFARWDMMASPRRRIPCR